MLEPDLAGHPVDRRVGLGHPQVHRVGVHRADLVPGGQRDQVTTDAAAQVGQLPARRVAAAAVPGHHFAGCLLQPVPGEEHLPGPAELGLGRDPQFVLGQCGGDEFGRVVRAQFGAPP